MALLARSLRLAGYRSDVTDPVLAQYRKTALNGGEPHDEADLKQLGALARDLDASRARLQPDLPPIRAIGGCGAAETPILVKTNPAGGRVWLITKFGFALCNARGIDGWNRTSCDRWFEADSDRPAELSGNYAYQARWPDGGAARGDKRIDPSSSDGDDDAPQIVTVSRQ